MQDGHENSLNRLRFWTTTVSSQAGVQRYGRGDGRKRKKKSRMDLEIDREQTGNEYSRDIGKPRTTDIVTSTEGRDCKTKGNLSHFLVC